MAKKGIPKLGPFPGTGTSVPGKTVEKKAKIKPRSGFGPVSPGGPGPASSKSKIGKGK